MITSLTVCVNYSDLLKITLPRLSPQVDHCVVVTSIDDFDTLKIARQYGATVHGTTAFYQDGASFNKAAALEEAVDIIFEDQLDDWILHIDADVLVPDNMRNQIQSLDKNTMYGAKRMMALTPDDFKNNRLQDAKDQEMAGWFQLFHAHSVARPWYDASWRHAGGYDSEFWMRFKSRQWMPFHVTHLGVDGQNWHGRRTEKWGELNWHGPISAKEIESRREAWLESKKVKRALDCRE